MIEVTYLNTAKQEKHTSFEDYNEFVRAQQSLLDCLTRFNASH
mgnify:FL=1